MELQKITSELSTLGVSNITVSIDFGGRPESFAGLVERLNIMGFQQADAEPETPTRERGTSPNGMSIPSDIANLLDNDVQDFKNGYKSPRDAFESDFEVDEIDNWAAIRTNSRKLREFWRDYFSYPQINS